MTIENSHSGSRSRSLAHNLCKIALEYGNFSFFVHNRTACHVFSFGCVLAFAVALIFVADASTMD